MARRIVVPVLAAAALAAAPAAPAAAPAAPAAPSPALAAKLRQLHLRVEIALQLTHRLEAHCAPMLVVPADRLLPKRPICPLVEQYRTRLLTLDRVIGLRLARLHAGTAVPPLPALAAQVQALASHVQALGATAAPQLPTGSGGSR